MSSIASNIKRRSSSRSIKRKKFDDEVVESSLVKTNLQKGKVLPPTMCTPVPVEKEKPKPETSSAEKKKVLSTDSIFDIHDKIMLQYLMIMIK